MPASESRSAPAPHLAAAAQAALATMADELAVLLEQDLQRLDVARAQWRLTGADTELRMAAHDLRGLGATYGVPLAGRIAGSLDGLLAGPTPRAGLIEAHVDAVRAVVREGAAALGDARGLELADALEAAVAHALPAELPQAA